MYKGYGLTEMSPLTHSTPMGSTKLSSVGVPVPNQITKVTVLTMTEALFHDLNYLNFPSVLMTKFIRKS